MYIVETANNKNIEAEVLAVSAKDFKDIKKSKRFGFDWDKLKKQEVYKLVPSGSNEIAGLMALTHTEPEHGSTRGFTSVELIESAGENVGRNKRFDRVAGCLLAYACREAFKKGYDGVLFLIPKTGLIKHYITLYKFRLIGRGLALDTGNSYALMARYL